MNSTYSNKPKTLLLTRPSVITSLAAAKTAAPVNMNMEKRRKITLPDK